MSMWGEVVGSLQETSTWQLLFAFVACTGYVLVQGRLLERRGKWTALAATVTALFAFVLETERWVDGVMLISVGIAGLGVFVATVWLVCNFLGLTSVPPMRSPDVPLALPPVTPDNGAPSGLAHAAVPPRAAPSH